MPVIDVRHPLVKHKVGLLREADISTKKFRAHRDFKRSLEACGKPDWRMGGR